VEVASLRGVWAIGRGAILLHRLGSRCPLAIYQVRIHTPKRRNKISPPLDSKGCLPGAKHDRMTYPVGPDGRYLVVRGRLWRCTDPALPAQRRKELTKALMDARREKGKSMRAGNAQSREEARQRVHAAKQSLGERGAVWWADDAPDWNRHMARNTPYAEWFAGLPTTS